MTDDPRECVVDVSELEPPDPLVRTLAAAEALSPGNYIRMLHRRDPCLLPDNLRRRGFCWLMRSGERTAVEVFIWREGDTEAERAVQEKITNVPR